jgi:murein DD-endopeptidase MepM/ murein hydrolase activator NlpD
MATRKRLTLTLIKRLVQLLGLLLLPVLAVQAQTDHWRVYSDASAGYAFEYPAQSHLSTGSDATQGYDSVFVALEDGTDNYQGYAVTVFDNANDLALDRFLIERRHFNSFGGQNLSVAGQPALRAARHTSLAGVDADVYWIKADQVVVRIGLYAGPEGSIEPSPESRAAFDRAISSFRLIPRAPASTPTIAPAPLPAAVEAAVADQFQSPFQIATTTAYDEQWNIITNDTRYGVRNLSLTDRRCYGVVWNRMLHSALDLYRADGLDAAGTTVVAVADGQVAYYDPGYASYPGRVVIVRHRLEDGRDLYSVYAHLNSVYVAQNQPVSRGQAIGTVLYQPGDSHLHFEMRWFLDGSWIYPSYTSCNGIVYGRGYTYLIHPDNFPAPNGGYVNPDAFIQAHGGAPLTPIGLPDPYTPTVTLQAASVDLQVLTATQSITAVYKAALDPNAPITITKVDPFPTFVYTELITTPVNWLELPLTPTIDLSPTAVLTETDPVTYTVFLPLVSRLYPRQEPACIEGQELLINGNFDGGPGSAPWVQIRNGSSDLIDSMRSVSPAYSLWLGGRDNADEEALQAFVVPYYTDALTVTFKRFLITQETQPQVFDHFEVVIENTAGNELTPQIAFSNLSATQNAWSNETAVFGSFHAWGNQRLRLSLKGMTDGGLATSLFVDDVSIQTHCEP